MLARLARYGLIALVADTLLGTLLTTAAAMILN
jgi:hypothetical protein